MHEKMDRVTVAEAAGRLGVKEQAVRKRIQRGTLVVDKDDDGRVYVYLDPEDVASSAGNRTQTDTSMNTLVQGLQDQVAYLRKEVEDWKEEARRKDAIIMSLTQRKPEVEAVPEPRESPRNASFGDGVKVPLEEKRRSWLYRFFFGP